MTDKILNVHQRMAKAMQEVTYVRKEKKQGMQYSIVSHDVVTAKVRPALLAAGVHYYPCEMDMEQNGNRTQCLMSVRFVNIDDPSDCFDVATGGYGIDSQDKGPGKAISYAVKYALLKAMGLETGDDPDMDQDVEYEGMDDPHIAIIKMFEAEVGATTDAQALQKLAKEYGERLKKAAQSHSVKVNAARSKYAAKMKALEA